MTAAERRAAVARAVAAIEPLELASRRWSGARGRAFQRLDLDETFDLGGAGLLGVVVAGGGGDTPVRYLLAFEADPERPGELREAGPSAAAWVAMAGGAAVGATIPAVPRAPATAAGDGAAPPRPTAALVCRPAPALPSLVSGGAAAVMELAPRPLAADHSNTAIVLGDRLLVKVFRRLQPGLNPDLELNAYLSEEAGFEAVPRLAGYVELASPAGVDTVAIISEYLPDAEDGYESTAERLAGWLLAPGSVTVEFATEDAAELGRLTAGLHATLAAADGPDLTPRAATRDELRSWRRAAVEQLDAALAAMRDADPTIHQELRREAPAIAERFSVYEAMAAPPLLTRIHADYHLGQVLRTPDGFMIIDFEGEPTRSIEDRRRLASPLRDVASMLRSLDHVGRSAGRRAERRNGGPLERAGVDLDGWLVRSRERFLEAYRRGVREAGAPIEMDDDLLAAFEVEKECYEFVYAATYLPDWLWAPREGMRALLGGSG
jgi:maltose alpha-D-glucosyltransferase/alpha-amylase